MTIIESGSPVSKAVGRIAWLAPASVLFLGLGVGAEAQAGPVTSPSGVTREMARATYRSSSLDSLAGGTARWTRSRTENPTTGVDGWRVARITLYLALRSEEHTSELQSHSDLVCRLLLEKKKKNRTLPI